MDHGHPSKTSEGYNLEELAVEAKYKELQNYFMKTISCARTLGGFTCMFYSPASRQVSVITNCIRPKSGAF